MKSGREAALTRRHRIIPRSVVLPKRAIKLLVKLEYAKNYNDKTRYNNILDKLSTDYPEMSDQIKLLRWE